MSAREHAMLLGLLAGEAKHRRLHPPKRGVMPQVSAARDRKMLREVGG